MNFHIYVLTDNGDVLHHVVFSNDSTSRARLYASLWVAEVTRRPVTDVQSYPAFGGRAYNYYVR